jgi:hypothetical protein
MQLDDVSVILTDVQEIKSSKTKAKPEPIQMRKRHCISNSSDKLSVEVQAITDKGSTVMEDGLSESGENPALWHCLLVSVFDHISCENTMR